MTSLKISNSFQVFIHESTHLHSNKNIQEHPDYLLASEHSHKHCVKMKAFALLALTKMFLAEHLSVQSETEPRTLPLPEQADPFFIFTNAQKS